jgi:hypothetical protein
MILATVAQSVVVVVKKLMKLKFLNLKNGIRVNKKL